ncbi:MAG: hypothetical protein ABSH46_05045 [Bryobacteraceae bacterium]|jgi:hypothetical protein
MLKKFLLVLVAVVFVAAVGVAHWVGVIAGWWDPLVRPANVTSRAHYVFIWESAAWFDCSVDARRNVNVCKAWNDDGRLVASGDFRLKDENRAATSDELHPSALGPTNEFGGSDTIYLFGPKKLIMGKELVRVPDSPPARAQ